MRDRQLDIEIVAFDLRQRGLWDVQPLDYKTADHQLESNRRELDRIIAGEVALVRPCMAAAAAAAAG